MNVVKFLLPILFTSILSAESIGSIYIHKCANCHGRYGENQALGKGKAINTMTVYQIANEIQAIASGKRKTIPMIKKTKMDFLKNHNIENIYEMAVYIKTLR